MKKYQSSFNKLVILLSIGIFTISACKKTDDPEPMDDTTVEDYDRQKLLNNTANGYIVPAYQTYATEASKLKSNTESFIANPSEINLTVLKSQWKTTLMVWQDVAFLEFGPAANIGLRAQTNVYPTDTNTIQDNIIAGRGNYNLASLSNFEAKGFQALDYLLHGIKKTDEALIEYYTDSINVQNYLLDLVTEIDDNAKQVVNTWSTEYATSFIANSGSNAQGSSISDMVNAISMHYESYIRRGKVGIPIGSFNTFSKTTLPGHVEAFYYGNSLPFIERSVQSIKKFINGINYTNGLNGEGLDDYIIHIDAKSDDQLINKKIDDQIAVIITEISKLNDPFSKEVDSNYDGVNNLLQQLQKLIPSLKVEMTDALGVLITYQDNDGD